MMVWWGWTKPNVTGAVALGVGGVVVVLVGFHFQRRAWVRWRVGKAVHGVVRTVKIVTSPASWDHLLPHLYREARREGAVGLDCEWVQVKGARRSVALLQLATSSGLCMLVRLTHLKTALPPSLKEFLADESVLKVGVGTLEDSDYLYQDYGLQVRGCVDLRHLVVQWQYVEGLRTAGQMGLNALTETYLGRTLDKDWRVRASDWESNTLTRRQKNYAAEDALVGIQLLLVLVGHLWGAAGEPAPPLLVPLFPASMWYPCLAAAIHHICHTYRDLKFSSKKQETGEKKTTRVRQFNKPTMELQVVTRKGPLYHNCQLLAPDNQPLCTIDPKKARWYMTKGLGQLVSEDPLVVRLKFEPTGRPQAEREDGEFYLQARLNICVVCGRQDSCVRKNIVPHEYRKHFPALLKHHQNHDVVLLCFPCHRRSNMLDNELRAKLGKEFQAPAGTEPEARGTIDESRKAVRNAARALLKYESHLPESRTREYQQILRNFFGYESPTEQQLQEAANMWVRVFQEGHREHGAAVVQDYMRVGLSKLEQRWRQHFLDVMKPRFMPECWSVTHNMYKMKLKMARLPLDHPDRQVYKMALVGTEGTIHVPYNARHGRGTLKDLPSDGASPMTEKGNRIIIISSETGSEQNKENHYNSLKMPKDVNTEQEYLSESELELGYYEEGAGAAEGNNSDDSQTLERGSDQEEYTEFSESEGKNSENSNNDLVVMEEKETFQINSR